MARAMAEMAAAPLLATAGMDDDAATAGVVDDAVAAGVVADDSAFVAATLAAPSSTVVGDGTSASEEASSSTTGVAPIPSSTTSGDGDACV